MSIDNTTFRRGSSVYSIFGQIEEVAASIMIAAGKATRIEVKDFPLEAYAPDVHVNALGERAKFAILMPRQFLREFEDTIARLRA